MPRPNGKREREAFRDKITLHAMERHGEGELLREKETE